MKKVKSTFSVSFFLKRNAQKANGNMPVIARITINGEVAQFSSKLEIAPESWSIQLGKAIGKSKETVQVNSVLDGIKAKIQSHYHSLLAGGKSVTSDILKNSFLGIDDSYETILAIFDKHNVDFKKLVKRFKFGICYLIVPSSKTQTRCIFDCIFGKYHS